MQAPDLLIVSIGLGLLISLSFSELFGLSSGGLITSGYFAISFHRPQLILSTIAISFFIVFLIHILSHIFILFGKRKFAISILLGFFLGQFSQLIFFGEPSDLPIDQKAIGLLIPGILAYSMHQSGWKENLTSLVISASIVRLCLIVIFGAALV